MAEGPDKSGAAPTENPPETLKFRLGEGDAAEDVEFTKDEAARLISQGRNYDGLTKNYWDDVGKQAKEFATSMLEAQEKARAGQDNKGELEATQKEFQDWLGQQPPAVQKRLMDVFERVPKLEAMLTQFKPIADSYAAEAAAAPVEEVISEMSKDHKFLESKAWRDHYLTVASRAASRNGGTLTAVQLKAIGREVEKEYLAENPRAPKKAGVGGGGSSGSEKLEPPKTMKEAKERLAKALDNVEFPTS